MNEKEREKEKVLEGLKMDFRKPGETKILVGIGAMANSFESLDKDLRPLVTTSARIRKNFEALAVLCGMYLGYTYKREMEYGRGHWDMRNEAAAKFCYGHWAEFEDLYKKVSGQEIRYQGGEEPRGFIRDFLEVDRESMELPIVSEIRDFSREHPTIQQKMMGSFIRILDKLQPKYGFGSVVFPFI